MKIILTVRRVLFFILCSLLCLGNVQAANFNFNSLSVKDGLPDNYIHDIVQDSYGFMWIVTANKLSRFDGYNFKNYPLIPEGPDVYSINEDANKNIWVQAGNKYYRYNREKDILEEDITSALQSLSIPSNNIDLLVIDHDGNLWCQTEDTLVFCDLNNNWQSCIILPYGNKLEWIECREGHAFFLFEDGMIGELNHEYNKIVERSRLSLSVYPHHRMYLDHSLNLWFYTSHSPEDILQYYNPETKELKAFRNKDNKDFSFITSIMDDGHGNIWIGTDSDGITVYNLHEKSYRNIKYDQENSFSLPSNHIKCFYYDSQNIMWVGTSKRGIGYTAIDQSFFERCNVSNEDDISCILEDYKGNLWFGFDGEGISKIDVITDKSTIFNLEQGTLPEDLVVCSFIDSKGRIWVGTYGGGVCYYENEKFNVVAYKTEAGEENPLRYIRAIEEDAEGNIWIGTVAKGLFCYSNNGSFSKYSIQNSDIQSNGITDLYCRQGNKLYIGTTAGACIWDVASDNFVRVMNVDHDGLGQDSYVNCIFRDSRNLLWIGGKNGISVLDDNQNLITHLKVENGLTNNFVRAISEDLDKNLWLTSDYGVTNIVVDYDLNSKTYHFRCYRYYDEDGLGDVTFNNHSILCNTDGEILMGGIGGYIRVLPESIPDFNYNQQIEFTALYIGSDRIEVGEPLKNQEVILGENIQLLNEISLDYKYNNFAIDVSSFDFRSLNKTIFAYRLNDDSEWIQFRGNTIYFNELSPGIYNLNVKTVTSDENKNSAYSSLLINMRPPFWLSPIAYFLYFIMIILTAIALVIYFRRKNMLKIKMHKLEMEIANQKEMEEEKMRFFTNVSHDLRTPLSLIITPLERLISSANFEKNIIEELELIYRNAQLLMREVNQLLDLRKLDSGRSKLKLSHGNLNDFINQVCNTFTPYSIKRGIPIVVQLKSSSIEMDFDRNKLQRVLTNLLSNAFKFNVEGGSVKVIVDVITESGKQYALIEVVDTGIGIKEENLSRVFDRFYQETHQSTYIGTGIGLHIAKEYVLLHGGEIEVQQNEPQGSIFRVKLPIQNNLESFIESEENIEHIGEETKGEVQEDPILIVEDNDDFRHFIRNCLKDNYPVIEAGDGAKALEIMDKQPVKMVVSDIMMPVMDGLELCNRIKGDIRFSHIPVMLLTARTAEEHILEGLKEGADEYIIKPFNVEILLLRIEKLLEWRRNSHHKFQTVDIEPGDITISSLDEKLIKQAIHLVEENMDNQDFSVEELSAEIGMSRGHLYKKLMTITGKSPLEFIRIIRIKRGKQLVEESQLSISEIAYSIGFSPKQFSKHFKDLYGKLPSAWQKHNP
ncbi:Signal transduction histidine kinase [Draconibacterium orientale]|uniref:histidine kinase n=1 Tax=Draconibacterium orientale TaxID=1168034 RepID=A0A1I0JL04_9BACT|nr:two-component regulator propeller domain-containing protein [Draconibacterium orientale]SEU11024.1 Signal transduction histidine kinase [Draconibacterium orientale]